MGCKQGPNEAAGIKEALLVFLLPLVCAAGMVIWAVRFWSGLAEHPGYLALAALGAVCVALALAKVVTGKSIGQTKDNQTEK